MSGVPPFCALGNKYFYTTFNQNDGITIISNLEITGGQLKPISTSTGQAYITNSLAATKSSLIVFAQFQFYGNYNQWGTIRVSGAPDTGDNYCSVSPSGNPHVSTPGGNYNPSLGTIVDLKGIMDSDETTLKWYVNDILTHTYSIPGHGPSYTKTITITLGATSLSTVRCNEFYAIMSNYNGTPCQGEIPTSHREIVSSTAKISHSRILQEERNLIGAQNFHNIMKDLA